MSHDKALYKSTDTLLNFRREDQNCFIVHKNFLVSHVLKSELPFVSRDLSDVCAYFRFKKVSDVNRVVSQIVGNFFEQ